MVDIPYMDPMGQMIFEFVAEHIDSQFVIAGLRG